MMILCTLFFVSLQRFIYIASWSKSDDAECSASFEGRTSRRIADVWTDFKTVSSVSFLISRSSNCSDRMERMIISQRLRSFCDSAKIALRNWSILYTFSLWMTLLFSWAHASTSAVSNSSKERPCEKYTSDPYFVSTAMLRSHNT